MQALQWSLVAVAFPGAGVEVAGDLVAHSLRQVSHAGSFWKVLSDQAVRILVRASLPGVIRGGEVERDRGATFDFTVVVKFGAVVGGDGLEGCAVSLDQLDGSRIYRYGSSTRKLADDHQAGLALYQAQDAILGSGAHDGVGFPMTELATALD